MESIFAQNTIFNNILTIANKKGGVDFYNSCLKSKKSSQKLKLPAVSYFYHLSNPPITHWYSVIWERKEVLSFYRECFLSKFYLLFNHGLNGVTPIHGWIHASPDSLAPGRTGLGPANTTFTLLTLVYLLTATPRHSSIKPPFKIQSWKSFLAAQRTVT